MTARVLIVDDIPANVRLIEARLTAEYFDVITANSGADALALLEREPCDIVLLDVMMPGMDGFEVCRRLKANPATYHIPVVMVTALDQPADRVAGLEAGADDFLTKPISDLALLTRVRSLVRMKMMQDELRLRATTSKEIGIADPVAEAIAETGLNGRVMLVDDRASSYDRIVQYLGSQQHVDVKPRPQEALFAAADNPYDLIMVSMALNDFDALRLCSQIRSLERTRSLPLLVLADPEDDKRLMRALELGVNDYVVRPIDRNELAARVRTQIRKWRYTERLRHSLTQSIEMAVTDGLTGLHNRRYMDSHLGGLMNSPAHQFKPLTVLVLDIDHFKLVNDRHGHDAGDEVLREFANRIRANIRGIDLACRLGGEEFVVIMPDTDAEVAAKVAERIRERVGGVPFAINKGQGEITVTVSIGLASRQSQAEDADALIKQADLALYRAKREGRNRVVRNAA